MSCKLYTQPVFIRKRYVFLAFIKYEIYVILHLLFEFA